MTASTDYRATSEQMYLQRIAQGTVGTGLSSKALALYGLGLNPDLRNEPPFSGKAEPRDPSDLRRCFEAFEAAPPHIQERMLPVLAEWVEAVHGRYPEPKGEPHEVEDYVRRCERVRSLSQKRNYEP